MTEASAEFSHAVEAEVAAVRRFVSLLEREQNILSHGDADQLLDLLPEKNGLAAQLTTLANQRNQVLATEGLTADPAGVAAWFAAHPTEISAHAAWSLLLPLARQAHELNRVNGQLIQLRMQHNARALEALLGSTDALGLYGPNGQNTTASSRRISDNA
ncbi:flagellar protein FlgN [Accumulibacter sp.]|uniref:Flagellar protein FlgN n=1 Tax=Candidatus Accumulibacter proximus TaxID=2954385 RepID=A0A935PV68_9PROT|nr:flagellar protein FlgN [Accumulibacter sp.]MBK7673923.1 flagellar protein FlgN [Candidatus Accumulibacter proximus]MBL8375383.1 flagellar protein FlgN [Accumulibacter sp.]